MSQKYKTEEDQYADCDVCGERYSGQARNRYLRITITDDGLDLQTVCCKAKESK